MEFEMAKLYFRYGAMNCGKSTALIQVAHNYEERGMKTLIVKPSTDTKGSDKVVSRLGIERRVDILATKSDDLYVKVDMWRKEIRLQGETLGAYQANKWISYSESLLF